jgi:chlorophyll(ide) b reductase
MKVVVTGSTKGIGRALAWKFLELGDDVVLTSRNQSNLDAALPDFEKQFSGHVFGITCDVQDPISVDKLVKFALEKMSTIDLWVNNAGTAGSVRSNLIDMDPKEITRIINTNIVGTLLCCRAIIPIMLKQGYGHIFNMEGMGSDGRTYAGSLCYATSKRAIPMIQKTLLLELKGTPIGIHDISPGMVLTDLLLKGGQNPPGYAKILNILAEKPATVADYLVPRMRGVKGTGKSINFLTSGKAMVRFMTAGKRKKRFFDESSDELVLKSE